MTRPRLATLAFLLAALIVGAFMAHALRHGSAFQDDYLYIAVAQHLDSPWPLLTQDSVGSYFFRPVTMLFWWLSAAVLGESAPAHHALGIAVHVANGVLLHALLRRLQVSAPVAALAALGFVAHPSAVSAAAWLSDRFDLIATTFGLAALIAIDQHLERPTFTRLAMAGAAMLASILSKEIGFGVAAAGMLAALWPAGERHTANRRWRWALVAAIAAVAIVALVLRTQALRPVPDTDGLWRVLLGLLATGTWKWSLGLPAFLFVEQGRMAALVAWIATFVALAIAAARPSSLRILARGELARLGFFGLALMLLVAGAQSPTVANIPLFFFSRESFNPGGVVTARFYYLPLAGFALAIAAAAESIARSPPARPAVLVLCTLAVGTLIGFAATSRTIARHWAQFTHERAGVFAKPAVDAVSSLRGLAPGCKIYLLDTPAAADMFRDMIDTGVKKSLPRGHPALACFIQAEHAPWYHLLARDGLPADAERPFEIILAGGRPYPPLVLGNLAYYFVRVMPGDAALDDPLATFLAFRGGRYVDVTADVRSRKRVPRLYDRRAQ